MLEPLLLVVFLVGSITLPPMALWWLTQRSRWAPFFRSLAGVGLPFVGLMGVLFSLNLVFVCNEIWQTREAAKSAMSREGEAIRNLSRIAAGMPSNSGADILKAAREYLEATNELDFNATALAATSGQLAASEKSSLAAVIKFTEAVLNEETLERLHPSIRPIMLAKLTTVRDKRLERLSYLSIEPSRVKWLALLYLEFMTLIGIALVHITAGRALFVASFVYLAGVNPFLLALYASKSPFSGLDPLTNVTLLTAQARISDMEALYKKGMGN